MNPQTARIAVSGVTYWVDRPYTYSIPEELAGQVVPGMRVAVPFGGVRPREGIVLALDGETDKNLKSILEVLDEEPPLTERQIKLALWMRERFFCTVMDAVRAMLPSGLWYRVRPVYCIRDGLSEREAYSAAGSSGAEKLALDAVFGHGGRCEFADIELVFGQKNPGTALASLVKKCVLTAEADSVRRGADKTIRCVTLAVSPEEAISRAEKNPRALRQSAVLRVLAELRTASVADICYFTGANRDAVKSLEKKGLVTISNAPVYRRPSYEVGEWKTMPVLNEEQQKAFEGIRDLLDSGKPQAALLLGVTGSGKTTIYIRLIDEVLKKGRSAIFMVPEIALTPQMLKTFSSYFGDRIAVLHSSLSMGERYDEWKRIRSGDARVVIGTRSAVFAPVSDPGIIIIDEEQEDTYKSESNPRYHARDVAKYICAHSNATLVLGSATPDVCSRYNAQTGRYHFFSLPSRYNAMQLPSVRIADMKQELKKGNMTSISSLLREEIEENLRRDEQTILFINRRGASKLVTCGDCGYIYECPNCSSSLTYHSVGDRLICHYCGYTRRVDRCCPSCGGTLNYIGAGTQKVVEELGELFPDVPVLRMDTDSVAPVGNHRTLFEKFRAQKIPLLVGTQMVAKGLNFENVTLVGVLSADQSLYASSYRAGERTFSLITQVVGRSGRFEKTGRAVIQTFTPENQIVRQAAEQDYDRFYESELALRRVTGAPPFSDLYVLTATGENEENVLRCCADVRALLISLMENVPNVVILGPAPLPVARVNRAWRYRVTMRCPENPAARQAVSRVLLACNNSGRYRGVSLYADFNPLDE